MTAASRAAGHYHPCSCVYLGRCTPDCHLLYGIPDRRFWGREARCLLNTSGWGLRV